MTSWPAKKKRKENNKIKHGVLNYLSSIITASQPKKGCGKGQRNRLEATGQLTRIRHKERIGPQILSEENSDSYKTQTSTATS